MSEHSINEYLSLIKAFISGAIKVLEFETKYLELFKSDECIREEAVFLVLDKLFSDVDIFCADPSIRKPNDLDEEGLIQAATYAYDQLKELI
jgi:hypothetical protein